MVYLALGKRIVIDLERTNDGLWQGCVAQLPSIQASKPPNFRLVLNKGA